MTAITIDTIANMRGMSALSTTGIAADRSKRLRWAPMLSAHAAAGRNAHGTTHRALQNCGRVFRYAVATGRARIS
jgi:hypothetical protein